MPTDLSDGPTHDHVCLAYDDTATLERHARDWLTAGDAAGQRVWYIGPDRPAGIDAEHIPLDTAYSGGAPVDPETQAELFLATFRTAVAEGFTGIRVVADVTPLVRTPAQREAWFRYEHLVDRLMAVHWMSGMCAFDRSELCPDDLADLACLHPEGNVAVPFRLHACPPDLGRAALRGELDLSTADRLARAMERAGLHLERGEIVLNAAGLRFADHRTLIRLDRWADGQDATLVLRGACEAVARLAALLELQRLKVEAWG